MSAYLYPDETLQGIPFILFSHRGIHQIQFSFELMRYFWWVNGKLRSTANVSDFERSGFWKLPNSSVYIIVGVDGIYRPYKSIRTFEGLRRIYKDMSVNAVRVVFNSFRVRDSIVYLDRLKRDRVVCVYTKKYSVFLDGSGKVLLLELISEGTVYDTISC
jgi:hypothetical protein